jgi:farnesyl-diphosphate farnesyltransferase
MAVDPQLLLSNHLAAVSRSFYLTLKILPKAVRTQIGLAYLLARTTDTIADTDLVPVERRLEALRALDARIQGTQGAPVVFRDLAGKQGSPAEKVLLENCEDSVALLETLTIKDRDLIRSVLRTITSGQELDLRRFATASAASIVALVRAEELDDYTYRVAGCVGEFWTHICRAHLFPKANLDESALFADAVRFGKGLQLVNILRDLPADLRLGRCYLPDLELRTLGLTPSDLLDSKNEARFRPLFEKHLTTARGHLDAGWRYTCTLPYRCVRVRLACAWPVLLGLQTLQLLATRPVLTAHRLKVDRRALKAIMLRSVLLYPFPTLWRRLGALPPR